MRTWSEFTAASIGTQAWETHCLEPAVETIGVTSRGLFLIAPSQRIVFVSYEPRRSPLTITLDRTGARDHFRALDKGDTAQFSANRLIFPSLEITIVLPANAVWQPALPFSGPLPHAGQLHRLRAIAQEVLARKGGAGLAALLPRLLDFPESARLSTEQSAVLEKLISIRRAMQTGNDRQLIDGMTNLLGQGRGLTPSGDDAVIGMLLMLSRWHIQRDWRAVSHAVSEAAYRSTTAISANLIECAADGQGDERLITVVEGIVAGSPSIDECVDCVLDWGSSSGVDALVGMALALTAF
jgi:hypothetical protein